MPDSNSGFWPLLAIIAGLVGGVVGYGLSLWRNRLLPWVTILRFSDTVAMHDLALVPDSLVAASEQAWTTIPLRSSSRLGDVRTANFSAGEFLRRNTDSVATIETGLQRLRGAANSDDVQGALLPLLLHPGIRDELVTAIWRSAIPIPTPDRAAVRVLQIGRRNDFGGCYIIDFPSNAVPIGDDLNENTILADRLLPFLEVFSRLQGDAISVVFTSLLPLMQEQSEIHRLLGEESRTILNEHSRWTAHFAISNYGSTPFLLFPDAATLAITGAQIRTFDVPCHITFQDETGVWTATSVVYLVQPGTTSQLLLVTNQKQIEIPNGEVLRGMWQAGTAFGQIRLQVRGRELPGRRKVISNILAFRR